MRAQRADLVAYILLSLLSFFCRALGDFPAAFFHSLRLSFGQNGIGTFKSISLKFSFDGDLHLAIRTLDLTLHLSIRDLQRFKFCCLFTILICKINLTAPLPPLIFNQIVGKLVWITIFWGIGARPRAS